MCGICGILYKDERVPDFEVLSRMALTLRHRGPDDEGIVVSGRAGIAARRLSIIDVTGGHQPIPNETESIWCASNGEIYNHPELIERLSRRGHHFRTRCDTEAIIHLYEDEGMDFLEHLDGMFALAIWDQERETLVLARDRLGIKPLYYADLGDRLVFGSELKALLAAGIPREIDLNALDAYFTLTYIPAPYSVFRHVRKVPAAHYVKWTRGQPIEIKPYWRLPLPETSNTHPEEASEELLHLLRAAVRSHMISDVPLGAFLSGGLDSSTVVALMAEYSPRPVKTFSIGFSERSFDETPHARRVAELFGTDHHELTLEPDPLLLAERMGVMYDEPFADSSAIPTWTVAGLAREHVTVALTGDGGDEVFGGYEVYRADALANLYRRIPDAFGTHLLPSLMQRLPATYRKAGIDLKLQRFARSGSLPPADAHLGWRTIVHSDTRERLISSGTHDIALRLMRGYFDAVPNGSLLDRALHADTLLGLPDDMLTKVDRATMAVSLEARVPLLDRAVVEFMARLPSDRKVHGWQLKRLLKRSVHGILPDNIVNRKKAGFSIPVSAWLKNDLRGLVQDTLAPHALRDMSFLDPTVVQEIVEQHLNGRVDRGREIWSLLMLALWHREYMPVHGPEPATAVLVSQV
jgi:asparagine synthase (glutamine-hydrolysing)